jgi:hypothetical protein
VETIVKIAIDILIVLTILAMGRLVGAASLRYLAAAGLAPAGRAGRSAAYNSLVSPCTQERKTMKTTAAFLLILMLAGLMVACEGRVGPVEIVRGSGTVVTETREAGGFDSITLDGAGQLVIDQTGSESLSITADDNFLPYIETRVRGRELIISIQKDVVFNDITELTYNVTVSELIALELNGAADITISNLSGEEWSVELNGAGRITVAGEVTRQTVELNGAGSYEAAELKSQQAIVKHSGAGLAVVQVSDTLDATIDGIGSIEYIGDPQVTQDVSGLGSVRQR